MEPDSTCSDSENDIGHQERFRVKSTRLNATKQSHCRVSPIELPNYEKQCNTLQTVMLITLLSKFYLQSFFLFGTFIEFSQIIARHVRF